MADVITRFKLETTQFDSKLRDTAKALQGVAHQAELGGKDFDKFSDEAIKSARALGTVQSGATNTKDKLRDLVGSYNDAAKAYNSLTDAAKKGEFGKAMSQSLTQLQQRIRETKQELYGLGDSAKGGGLFVGDKLSGMLQVFGGNVMTKIAGAGLGLAGELKDMVTQGIELARQGEGIRIAFERLGRGDLLDGLRQATHGTVTDLELMKAAVKFNDFKLPVEELGTMLAFAQQKAKDTGQSVDYMVDSIVTGLGRKSLMILDNLGLSAAEIKDKMKETGDMTKAVGEIIREQMSKAGDYVETAADRATKANVELENAMTRLGETFQPLTDAGLSMFNNLKIEALDFMNKALRPMINLLTEAGRIRKLYNAQKGTNDAKIQEMLGGLSQSELPQHQHRVNLAYWDKNINKYEQYLTDYQAMQEGIRKKNPNIAAGDRVRKFQQETGLTWVSDVKEQLAVFKQQKAEYVKLSKDLLTTTVQDNKAEEQSIDSLTKKLKELQAERKKAISGGDSEKAKDLLKQINQIKSEIKGLGGNTTDSKQPKTELEQNQNKIKTLTQEYIKLGDQETESAKNRQTEIQKEIELLQKRNNLIGLRTEQAQGKFLNENAQTTGLATTGYIIDRSHLFDTEGGIGWKKLTKYNDQTSVSDYKRRRKEREEEDKKAKKDDKSIVSEVGKITSGVSGIFNGIEQMGIKIPEEMKGIINGIQGVMTILTSINTILGVIEGMQTVGLIPFFARGGIVPHAASGMMVPGNDHSDRTPVLVSSGELILNSAQQNALANELQGAGIQNLRLRTELSGRNIIVCIENDLKARGKGQLATFK